jgi:hypothetical protein
MRIVNEVQVVRDGVMVMMLDCVSNIHCVEFDSFWFAQFETQGGL